MNICCKTKRLARVFEYPLKFIARGILLTSAIFASGFVNAALAQSVVSPSSGCTAANAGTFDFTLLGSNPPVSSPFSAPFTSDEILTFTLTTNGFATASTLVEDTTASVVILTSTTPASAAYTVPSDGSRDFDLELDTTESEATITVTCTAAPQGSITITKDSGGVSGVYSFAGDLGGFMINVAGAAASQSFPSLTPGVYTISEAIPEDFSLQNISCTGDLDSGSVFNLAAGQVDIDLDADETINCTFTNSLLPAAPPPPDIESHAIRNFLYRRASAILSSEPDRARLARKNPGALWPGGVSKLTVNIDENNADAEFAASTASAWVNDLDLWIEGHYTSYNSNSGAIFEGDVGLVYIGADYLLSQDLLVGVLGQLDWTSETSSVLGEDISGNGWMVGPYLSAQLQDNLFFDARAAWGRSKNDLSIAGLVTNDQFETSRWLLRGNLTGNHQYGRWRITPSVAAVYFEETQESYLSSSGALINEQTVALGRLSFEPELAYQHVTQSGVLVEPQLTLAGLWDFETPDNLSIPGWTVVPDEFRMRVGGGFQIAWPSGFALHAHGFYDGIGASNFESFGARAWFDIPFGSSKGRSKPPAVTAPVTAPPAASETTTVLFEPAKANLSPEAYAALESLWAAASGNDVAQILLEASGDEALTEGQMALAARRGEALKQALANLGAPNHLIEIVSNGAFHAGEAIISIYFR